MLNVVEVFICLRFVSLIYENKKKNVNGGGVYCVIKIRGRQRLKEYMIIKTRDTRKVV